MSENENQQATIASNLCKNGCGFYGSTQFDGMCSVCHKENMKKKQKQEEEQMQSGKQSPSPHGPAFCGAPAAFAGQLLEPAPTPLEAGGVTTVPSALTVPEDSAVSDSSLSSASAGATTDVGKLKKRNRCGVCKKKVGLTGFDCRCGGLYCGLHRYSDKHDCGFDYQSLGQSQIRQANPQVVSSKIDKL